MDLICFEETSKTGHGSKALIFSHFTMYCSSWWYVLQILREHMWCSRQWHSNMWSADVCCKASQWSGLCWSFDTFAAFCSFSKKPSKPVGKKWTGPGSSAIVREHQIGMLGIKSELDMNMGLGAHQNMLMVSSSKIGWFQILKELVITIFWVQHGSHVPSEVGILHRGRNWIPSCRRGALTQTHPRW